MNHYESVFILTPVLSEDQAKEAAKKFKKSLTELGAKVMHEESWGLRKLAYPIQKKSTGFYHLFEFQAGPKAIADLEIAYKRDERILRFLTIKLDKHAIAFSERRRGKLKGGDKPSSKKQKTA